MPVKQEGKKARKKQLIVYLDENVHKELKMRSVMDSTSMNALVTDALKTVYDLGITPNKTIGIKSSTE